LSFKTQKSALLTWSGRHSLKEACDQIVHLHIIMKYMFSPPSSQQASTQFVVLSAVSLFADGQARATTVVQFLSNDHQAEDST
jgi:hypothetical protein